MHSIPTRLVTIFSLLGAVACASGCSAESDPQLAAASAVNEPCVAGSSTGGAAASAGSGGGGGTERDWTAPASGACADFLGEPVTAPFGRCGGGVCLSCPAPIDGIPFVRGTFLVHDDSGRTTANVRHEPGAACLSGKSEGFSLLQLLVGAINTPLDAAALGITQFEVTIDSPPSVGVGLSAFILLPNGDTDPGFDLTPSRLITSSAPFRASLSAFQNPGFTFDSSQLLSLGFGFGPAEPYDFCVRDFKFLDANGNQVLPPR